MPFTSRQVKRLLDPDLVPAERTANRAQRITETWLKRRMWRLEETAVKRLHDLYLVAYSDIRTLAYDAGERMGVSTLSRDKTGMQWREAMIQGATGRINQLRDDAAANGLRAATAAWMGSYYGKAWQLDTMTVADWSPKLAIVRGGLERAAQVIVQEDVYDDTIRNLLGLQWREQYAEEMDELVLKIRRAVLTGMQEGESIPAIMARVRDAMGIQTNRALGYRANFNRVQALTRTLVNKISNDATIAVFRQNADVMQQYEWLTARDERVCPVCQGLDGNVYDLDNSFRPPRHPNCRCTLTPVMDPDLLLGPQNLPTAVSGGQLIEGATLEEWLALLGLAGILNEYLFEAA